MFNEPSFWRNYIESQTELDEPVRSERKPLDFRPAKTVDLVEFSGAKHWSQTVDLAAQVEFLRPKGELRDQFEAEKGGFGAESAQEPVKSGTELDEPVEFGAES